MNLLLAVKNKINKRFGYLAVMCAGLFVFSAFAAVAVSPIVSADHCGQFPHNTPECQNYNPPNNGGNEDREGPEYTEDPAADGGPDLIQKYLNPLIAFLAGIVGLVVTISIVAGGIQYSSAGGDPQKVAKAKNRITNALIALLAFLFLFTFLEWIVPGGLIN